MGEACTGCGAGVVSVFLSAVDASTVSSFCSREGAGVWFCVVEGGSAKVGLDSDSSEVCWWTGVAVSRGDVGRWGVDGS